MAEAEKLKVLLKCNTLKGAYCPGEDLTGEVHLDVKEPVTFSALKLHILGVEQISGLIPNSFSCVSNRDSLMYLNHWITFTSPATNNSISENLTYETGCYKFPFSVPLAPTLPPSFSSINAQSYIRLVYTATAVFEIFKQHKVVSETYFRIKSVVPYRQITAHANCELRIDAEALVYRHSFMGWVHGKRLDESVHISARVDPCFICIAKQEGEGSRDKITFTLRLSVRNNTLKVLKDVEAQIQQTTNIHYGMLESSESTLLTQSCVRKAFIQPGETRELAIEMKLDAVDFNSKAGSGLTIPLPSFSTPFLTSNYMVLVNFPKNKVQRNIAFHGLFHAVEEVSMVRGAVRAPLTHTPANAPTEAPYRTYPMMITPLEGDLFPAEPQPYLPRPAPTSKEGEREGEEEGVDSPGGSQVSDEVREGDATDAPPAHMIGTPLPGSIVKGQVYRSPTMWSCAVFEAFSKQKKGKLQNKPTSMHFVS